MKTKFLILFSIAWAVTAQGAPRSSANYSIATETTDSGGQRTASAHYSNDGSAGGIAGISTVSSPVEIAKAGYIGQLYDVTGLAINASPASVDELATLQLGASLLLDDESHLDVDVSSVAWSVVTGPVTSITGTGLATAGAVYQDAGATVQGALGGLTGNLNLTVLNLLPDNFGRYAGDGLDDAWQNQYFGLNNPNADPLIDPDGDGQNNRFEFIAGIVPTDPNSHFDLQVEPVAGQPGQKRLIFGPRWTDRTYNVLTSTTLEPASWSTLTGGIVSDSGTERSVTDTAATALKKFYQVEIIEP